MTAAFCRTIAVEPNHSQAWRAGQIGNFAFIVYGQFKSPSVR
jgi:hypothetical protein